MKRSIFSVVIFFLVGFCVKAQPDFNLDLNTNVNFRTIDGNDPGNYLDISMLPTLNIADIIGAQFFINIPYNLATNKIRKVDLTFGNAFRYAYLGNEKNYIKPGAIQNFSMGFSNLVVNGYNNQIDETNRRVGAVGKLETEYFSISAMTNDLGKPKVFAGNLDFAIPIIDNFKVSFTGGMDTDPDNNSSSKGNVAAYGVDLFLAIPFDENANNYLYTVGGAATINKHGNGQVGVGGLRLGTSELFVDLYGALIRLGPGFEWGFFDTFYERDRRLGFSKADALETKYPKASGGTNFGGSLGYSPRSKEQFSLQLGGFYFTNYSGTDLNEFQAAAYLYIPRNLIGQPGELLTATLYFRTKAFENLSGLIDVFKKPNDRTFITLNVPITVLNDLAGLGRLAFVLNYTWSFHYDALTNNYAPQRNLVTGVQLISDINLNQSTY
jgi:hypothetical protein